MEEDIAKIESAIAGVRNSIDTMEVVAIVAVAVLGVMALGGIGALIFKASSFQRIPATEDPHFTPNNQEPMKAENLSKHELAEVHEEGENRNGEAAKSMNDGM